MATTKPIIIKTLLRCTHCGRMEMFDSEAVIIFDNRGLLYLRGITNYPLEFWDNFAKQLPEAIRHEHDPLSEKHQPHV